MTSYDVSVQPSRPARYAVRHLKLSDLGAALSRGFEDFWAMPSHLLFLGIFYPLAGVVLGVMTAGQNAFDLLYPLLSGFVLVGPVAAIGLYEMSRRRERGETPEWRQAFAVMHAPGLSSIVALGALLAVIFVAWLFTAHALYTFFFRDEPVTSYGAFFAQVFGTAAGLKLIFVGNVVGLVFAIVALALSIFSFPMMLDRHVDLGTAVRTSLRATRDNAYVIAVWGLIVTALLILGMAAALVGLAIVMPVLAHATWHLYRRAIGPPIP